MHFGQRCRFFAGLVSMAVISPVTAFADPVTIEVGWFSAPPEAVNWVRSEISAFQQTHPQIKVETKNLDEPKRERFQTHEKFFGKDVENELAANVTGIDGQWGYLAPYLADKQLIEPLENFIRSGDGFDLNDFAPPLLRQVQFKGKTWAVPWLSWDTFLVADMDILSKAGYSNPPRTWDEFLDMAKRLTRDTNGDGQIDQWGIGYRTSDDGTPYLFLGLIAQQGGSLTRDGRFDSSDPTIEGSIRFMNNFIRIWNVAKDDGRSLDERLQDKNVRYAMHLEPNHTLGNAINNSHLRIAPLPSFDGQPHNVGMHRLYYAIRKSTREKEQASWEFVKWMTRSDISLPPVFAGFPVRRGFTNRADYQARMEGKIQHSELIFTSCEYGYFQIDRVFDVAPATERYWQIVVPCFTQPNGIPLALERAQNTANAYLGDWYPYN